MWKDVALFKIKHNKQAPKSGIPNCYTITAEYQYNWVLEQQFFINNIIIKPVCLDCKNIFNLVQMPCPVNIYIFEKYRWGIYIIKPLSWIRLYQLISACCATDWQENSSKRCQTCFKAAVICLIVCLVFIPAYLSAGC